VRSVSVKGSAGKPADRERAGVNDRSQIIRYKVKKGDSLSSLAQRFKTTPAEIKKQNRIRGNKIQTGQIIRIGGQSQTSESEPDGRDNGEKKANQRPNAKTTTPADPAGSGVYKVKKGDILDRIARKNSISIAQLIELNKLDRSGHIQPGQTIILR
jgi:LysM repeat protein